MKNNVLLILVFISGTVFGGMGASWFLMKQPSAAPRESCAPARSSQTELLLAQLENSGLPTDVQAIEERTAVQNAAELPSSLVRSDLPEDMVLGIPVQPSSEEKPSGIILDETQSAVVLRAKTPAHRAADGSSITMIEAPVSVKRIGTLADYKAFKQVARGSYPQADFSKEEVLVLESASNLPDNMFEIVEIIPAEQELKVLYRVNILGLDKKINTHSVQKIAKTALPVVLEQVL